MSADEVQVVRVILERAECYECQWCGPTRWVHAEAVADARAHREEHDRQGRLFQPPEPGCVSP